MMGKGPDGADNGGGNEKHVWRESLSMCDGCGRETTYEVAVCVIWNDQEERKMQRYGTDGDEVLALLGDGVAHDPLPPSLEPASSPVELWRRTIPSYRPLARRRPNSGGCRDWSEVVGKLIFGRVRPRVLLLLLLLLHRRLQNGREGV